MSTEVVTLGCRLPAGMVLEVGLQTTVNGGPLNRPIAQIKQLPNYKRVVLKGTHEHTAETRRMNVQVPSILNPKPFINRNISKDFWEEWKKDHPGSYLLAQGLIFEIKGDAASAKAAAIDAMAQPAILQPIDPSKKLRIGPNGETVDTFVQDE